MYQDDKGIDSPERTARIASFNQCQMKYEVHWNRNTRKFDGPAEEAHKIAWDACVAEFYDRSKSVYNQPAYDKCMNKRDVAVQLCTDLRQRNKEAGYCPGPQPLEVNEFLPKQ